MFVPCHVSHRSLLLTSVGHPTPRSHRWSHADVLANSFGEFFRTSSPKILFNGFSPVLSSSGKQSRFLHHASPVHFQAQLLWRNLTHEWLKVSTGFGES